MRTRSLLGLVGLALVAVLAALVLQSRDRTSPQAQPLRDATPAEPAAIEAPQDQRLVRNPQPAGGRDAWVGESEEVALDVVLISDFTALTEIDVHLTGEELSGKRRRESAPTLERQRFERVAPGRYRLEAWNDRWTSAPRELAVDSPSRVAEIEARLEIHSAHCVAGFVVDETTGAAIDAFDLHAEFGSEDARGVLETFTSRTVPLSSPEGRFAVAGAPLRATMLRLVVEAPGYRPTTTEWFSADEWVEGIVVSLATTAETETLLSGRVLTAESGEPIRNASVLVVGAGLALDSVQVFNDEPAIWSIHDPSGAIARGEGRARTDDHGRFRLSGPLQGPAQILVHRAGHRMLLHGPVELVPGESLDLGVLALESGGTLRGRVWTGVADEALDLRMVAVQRAGGAVRSVNLDAEQGFEISGLGPGRYRVSALAMTTPAGATDSTLLPLVSTNVELGAFETREVDLHLGSGLGGREIRGRVERVDDGLTDWRVAVLDVDPKPRALAFVEEDGSFRLPDLPDGNYTLVVVARDLSMTRFAATWRKLSIPEDANAELVVSIGHSRVALDGRVEAESVSVKAETDNPVFDRFVAAALQGRLDAEGRAVVYGLPAGSYRFESPFSTVSQALPAEGGDFRIDLR